ncbi:MAG TPA: hypothetical protein VKB96_12955, partial [Gammaproteobacteria bacterium]|nr:hypothetical protein [Gammaproteobacteria bacterium]
MFLPVGIDPVMAVQSVQRLAAHLLPGGIVASPFVTVWKTGDPLERDWDQTAVRPEAFEYFIWSTYMNIQARPYRDATDFLRMRQLVIDGRQANISASYMHPGCLDWDT